MSDDAWDAPVQDAAASLSDVRSVQSGEAAPAKSRRRSFKTDIKPGPFFFQEIQNLPVKTLPADANNTCADENYVFNPVMKLVPMPNATTLQEIRAERAKKAKSPAAESAQESKDVAAEPLIAATNNVQPEVWSFTQTVPAFDPSAESTTPPRSPAKATANNVAEVPMLKKKKNNNVDLGVDTSTPSHEARIVSSSPNVTANSAQADPNIMTATSYKTSAAVTTSADKDSERRIPRIFPLTFRRVKGRWPATDEELYTFSAEMTGANASQVSNLEPEHHNIETHGYCVHDYMGVCFAWMEAEAWAWCACAKSLKQRGEAFAQKAPGFFLPPQLPPNKSGN